jgi:predicted O-methyltransferase YrrM
MIDRHISARPVALEAIEQETRAIGFGMASEAKTGMMLRTLAASKPAGHLLELGTGTGVATAWLLAGMDAEARLESVDNDATFQDVAKRYLGADPRVTFHLADGGEYLDRHSAPSFDLVYADAWPGKFTHLDDALALVNPGGIYVVDDLLPQSNWPDGHASKVHALIEELESRREFVAVKMAWASGLMMLVRAPR